MKANKKLSEIFKYWTGIVLDQSIIKCVIICKTRKDQKLCHNCMQQPPELVKTVTKLLELLANSCFQTLQPVCTEFLLNTPFLSLFIIHCRF